MMGNLVISEHYALIWSFIISAIGLVWWYGYYAFPIRISNFNPKDEWHRKMAELERDRVLSSAKGIASTSAGFFIAILTALLKGEIAATVPMDATLGCVAGALGALLLAAAISASTQPFTSKPGG